MQRRFFLQKNFRILGEGSFWFHQTEKRVIMGTSDAFGYTKESEAGT